MLQSCGLVPVAKLNGAGGAFGAARAGRFYAEHQKESRDSLKTDKEVMIAMFEKMGLIRSGKKAEESSWMGKNEYMEDGNTLILGAGGGYNGFAVEFEFDDDGSILKHSVWE